MELWKAEEIAKDNFNEENISLRWINSSLAVSEIWLDGWFTAIELEALLTLLKEKDKTV